MNFKQVQFLNNKKSHKHILCHIEITPSHSIENPDNFGFFGQKLKMGLRNNLF